MRKLTTLWLTVMVSCALSAQQNLFSTNLVTAPTFESICEAIREHDETINKEDRNIRYDCFHHEEKEKKCNLFKKIIDKKNESRACYGKCTDMSDSLIKLIDFNVNSEILSSYFTRFRFWKQTSFQINDSRRLFR